METVKGPKRYKVPSPEYPEEYPEYPGYSGISGCKPGVSGFSQAPENWTELESILVTRFVPDGLGL